MRIYSQETGRMVLSPASALLPQLPCSEQTEIPTDTNTAPAFIQKELMRYGIDLVPDGDYFVRVLAMGWQNSPMATLLARIPPPPPRDQQQGRASDLSPPGMASELPLDEWLEVYSEVRGRTVLRPAVPLVLPLRIGNQPPLSREEIAYALTVILTLNGLVVVDDGEHLVQIVPAPLASKVRLRAPKRAADVETIPPERVPIFSGKPRSEGGTSPNQDVDGLVAYYAELAGRKPVPSGKIGQHPVTFHVRTPLSHDELLYAIETTLAFDGWAIVHSETNTIYAGRLSELVPQGH